MTDWTRERVIEAVKRGESLASQNFQRADLWGADLRHADLRRANLRHADLRGANLRGANLRGADLRGADLQDADLRHANLQGADLRGADLWGVNLAGTIGGIMSVTGLPSGYAYIVPTPDGWRVRVGCWTGTVKELRRMIESDSWVESNAVQREVRRPAMLALCDLFDAHKKQHKGVVKNLRIKWGAK